MSQTRIALISDLHGNALALKEVLARIANLGVDQIVCLGDVATLGPDPERVLELVHESNAICILGNHDEFMHGWSLTTHASQYQASLRESVLQVDYPFAAFLANAYA